ncbi:hypothetical protein [Halobellus sp. EA9]|uniref:hypothetical protein n=1 Tax=Halobellus sp. EA9 TaxID=3421647 RepID=UPI003EBD17F1
MRGPTPSRRAAFAALTAVAHLALTAWVRRDARERGTDPFPWDVLTLLTGVVGALAYRRRR